MPNKLKRSGILFAAIFACGYILNLAVYISRRSPLVEVVLSRNQLLLLASIALFLISAFVEKLRWIQPAVFIALCPFSIIDDPRGLYGLGFFIIGALLLERADFFKARRVIKGIALLGYLLTIEGIAVVYSKSSITVALSAFFFIVAFGVLLWFLYKDRLVVFLKEPKPSLSLTDKGLSTAERSFVLETLAGKSQKEIAIDFELSESTIRNTLARAYKKLNVEDRVGLAIMGERFEIQN